MDVPLLIKQRMKELGLEQKDLAAAAQVTESYISQLQARKKAPPAPSLTDIYDKISKFLGFPNGELSKLADLHRQEDLKKKVAEPPAPLFKECRDLILRKCEPNSQNEVRRIFERQAFGEFERFVTRKLLDVAKRVAKKKLGSEEWLRLVAQISDRSYEQLQVAILEFLDTDVFNISVENCASFLDPLIESWNIDLKTFGMEIIVNRRPLGRPKRFEFAKKEPDQPFAIEPGLEEFLRDTALSGDATEEEIEFLKMLKFKARRPSPIYYYRELQNLRDTLHFPASAALKEPDDRTGTTAHGR